MTFSMIWAVNNKYTKEEIGKAGVQTVSALHGNLALVFENVTQLSTYIYLINIIIVTVHIKEHQEKLISTSRELTGIRKCKVPVAMDFFIREVMAQ